MPKTKLKRIELRPVELEAPPLQLGSLRSPSHYPNRYLLR